MIYIFFNICIFVFFLYKIWNKNNNEELPKVLMYYAIKDHLPKKLAHMNHFYVKPKEFEKQLKWLKKRNFNSFKLSEIVNMEKIPKKSIILTFEDGYKDNYKNAFFLLKKYKFKATIFLRNDELLVPHDEVKTMIQSGLIEIGAHTLNHANFSSSSLEETKMQIISLKSKIEKLYPIECTSLSYCHGLLEKNSIDLIKQLGFVCAVTTTQGSWNPNEHSYFEIPRIMVNGIDGLFYYVFNIAKS